MKMDQTIRAADNPTVQDVWNTMPAWGFPYIASTLAPAFAPPLTMIESGLGGKVIGTGAYTFWNDMLYLEVSVYQNLSAQTLRVRVQAKPTGVVRLDDGKISNSWRRMRRTGRATRL
jgi:hypothetical protein